MKALPEMPIPKTYLLPGKPPYEPSSDLQVPLIKKQRAEHRLLSQMLMSEVTSKFTGNFRAPGTLTGKTTK